MKKTICVYGAARDEIAPVYFEETEKLGEALARRGYDLVYGGGATGLMGAVARGVKAGGGRIHGVAPKFFDEPGVLYTEEYCDQFTFTETMRQRKQLMEDSADGFITLPGGVGTYEEFFEMLTLASLSRHQKPIALYNINGFYDPMLAFLDHAVREEFIGGKIYDLYRVFTDAAALLDFLDEKIGK